jgi:catechol 2,3-dioxygenase-like lactoylglutathione lyase family enzyme
MKRLHVHLHVKDLGESIGFYTALFGAGPVVEKGDYAKWLLDDPAVNFAISARCGDIGVSHLGFQLDDHEDLAALTGRLREVGRDTVDQTDAKCCYARSDKAWASDPQGVSWETFISHGAIETFGEDLEPGQGEMESPPAP